MTNAVLVFTCTNATSAGSTHGAGINSITITGTKESTAALTSIAVSGDYPTTFKQGGTFSTDGIIVTATYEDNTTQNVTSSATFSSPDLSTTGTKTVTVSYTEGNITKTTTYEITVEEYIDYATLPFSWEGGSSSDLKNVNGVTTNGLGSDYSASNSPYLVKFDGTGDYIQVKTDGQPGKVTIVVKMLGGDTSSSITVQGSADGVTFSKVDSLTISGAKNDILTLETTNAFAATDRYVRLYFNKGSNVGVGPITIAVPSTDPAISANATLSLACDATSGEISYSIVNPVDGASLTATTEADWISDFVVADDRVTFTATANTGAERTATVTLTYSTATKDVTVTQAAYVDPNAPGSENNPFTVAQALEAITSGTFDANTYYYVSGIISQIDEVNTTQYYNATYFISDDGQTTTQLEVFRGKYLDNENFTSEDQIQVGDVVTIYGKLTYYQSTTPEIASGNYLVSLDRKAVKYYLVGSFDEDPWIDHKIEMTKSGNIYTVEKAFEANTLFKILKIDETNNNETTWYGGETNDNTYGIHSGWYENIALSSTGKNFLIEAASDDKYTFTVNAEDPDALTLTVTGWHVPEVKYYLAGNWSDNWSDGKVELTENADGTFSASKLVGNGSRFKFVKTVDGAETWYGADQTDGNDYGIHSAWCTNIELSDNGNASAFVIQIAADQELVFTLNAADLKFSVTGWPISLEGNMFVKVTSQDEFADGAYLIVNETAGVAFDGSLETLDDTNNVISVNIVNNCIVANETTKASLFTIVNNGKITSASGSYIGVSSYANSLKQDDNATMYTNSITIEDGNADIAINTGTSGYMHLKYNKDSNQNRFRYYKSGQQDIQLYKLVTVETVPVTITSAGMATFSSEKAVDFSTVETIQAYIATLDSIGDVKYTRIKKVPANTGVLLRNAEGADKGAVSADVPVLSNEAESTEGNILVAVAEEVTLQSNADGYNNYILNNHSQYGLGFYKANGKKVGAGKAYMRIPETVTAREFIGFTEGGVSTGIEAIANSTASQSVNCFDLQGRRVAQPTRGLYIVNGKKVVLK